jgi:hypothetical protein
MKQSKKGKKSKATKVKTVKIRTGIRAGIWACCNY